MEELFLRVIDYLGTFAFAISGMRLAARKKFDLFGAYVIGFVTAIGGGTIRDILLNKSVFWMTEPSYLICTAVALASVILFRRYIVKLEHTLFLFDTIGLGLFTVVGISVTLSHGYNMLIAIILGAITGSAGGVIRDILINEIPLLFRKDIYAMACVAGGVIYYSCTLLNFNTIITQLLTMFTVIIIRIVARKTNYSLPTLSVIDPEKKNK